MVPLYFMSHCEYVRFILGIDADTPVHTVCKVQYANTPSHVTYSQQSIEYMYQTTYVNAYTLTVNHVFIPLLIFSIHPLQVHPVVPLILSPASPDHHLPKLMQRGRPYGSILGESPGKPLIFVHELPGFPLSSPAIHKL